MILIERLYRRIAYTFGIALIMTSGFLESERILYLPPVTWVVAALLFLLSWRIQKEYAAIILKLDGPDAKPTDPVAWLVGNQPHFYYLIWSAIYTFGTYIVVAIPIDWFIDGTRQWRPHFTLALVLLFTLARVMDPRIRPSFYKKKS